MADLKIYQSQEEFDKNIEQIRKAVEDKKLNDNYLEIIRKLKQKEDEVYRTLGDGKIEVGKKRMKQLVDVFYIHNDVRNECIKIANDLFNPKIIVDNKSISFGQKEIKIDGKTQKLNSKNKEELQEYFVKLCEHWNKSVTIYDKLLETLENSMWKEGIIEKNTINTIKNSMDKVANTLSGTLDGKVTIDNLPKEFLEEKRRFAGMFGNIIGNLTEGAKLDFESAVIQEIKNSLIQSGGIFEYEHGDTIGNEVINGKKPSEFTKEEKQIVAAERKRITGFGTDAKADVVFTLKGILHSPEAITLPFTFKYLSEDKIKTHSGSLQSIPEIISQEEYGEEYANYFRNLTLNMAYWIHMYDKVKDDEIILILKKILNKFAFSFIYGTGSEDKPYGNAIFFCGFFKGVHEEDLVENYFLPVSRILGKIYYYILQSTATEDNPVNDKLLLSWAGFSRLNNFIFEEANNEESYIMKLAKENELRNRIVLRKKRGKINIEKINPSILYNNISSEIGTAGITYNRGIITGENGLSSIFKMSHQGGIIL